MGISGSLVPSQARPGWTPARSETLDDFGLGLLECGGVRETRHLASRAARDLADWLAFKKAEGMADRSLYLYALTHAKFVIFRDRDLGDYTDGDVNAFLAQAGSEQYRHHLASLFDWAYRTRRIGENPMQFVPRRRRRKQALVETFTDAESDQQSAEVERKVKARVFDRLSIGGSRACWEWRGTISGSGYGVVRNEPGRSPQNILVHRFVYALTRGPIPDDKQIDHLCRNTKCANPAHVDLVTSRENTLRGVGPTAQNARKTHCKRGHLFDDDNTQITTKGRHCKKCARIEQNDRRARDRERGIHRKHRE